MKFCPLMKGYLNILHFIILSILCLLTLSQHLLIQFGRPKNQFQSKVRTLFIEIGYTRILQVWFCCISRSTFYISVNHGGICLSASECNLISQNFKKNVCFLCLDNVIAYFCQGQLAYILHNPTFKQISWKFKLILLTVFTFKYSWL